MMSKVQPLRVASVDVLKAREPERQALASAIKHRNTTAASIAALRKATATKYDVLRPLQQAVADAETAVEEAKNVAAQRIVNAASGMPGDAPPSLKTARETLQDARDQLEIAEKAQAGIEAQIVELEDQLKKVDRLLRDRVRDVIRASGAPARVVERYAAAHTELSRAYDLLRGMWHLDLTPEIRSLTQPPNYRDTGAAEPWRQAFAALLEDPDASLPGDETMPAPEAA